MMTVRKMLPAENMRKWFCLLGTVIGKEKKGAHGDFIKWFAKHFPKAKWFGPKWQHFVIVKFDKELFERAEELGLTRYQHRDTEGRIRSEGHFLVEESELATYAEGVVVKVSLGTIDTASQYFTGALPIRFELQVLQSSDEVEEVRRSFPEKKTVPGIVEAAVDKLRERVERRKEIELSDAKASEELVKSLEVLFEEHKIAKVMELLVLTDERIYLGAYRDEKNICWGVSVGGAGLTELEDVGRIPFAPASDRLSRAPIERAVSHEDFARRVVRTSLDDIDKLRRVILDGGHTIATRLTKRSRA